MAAEEEKEEVDEERKNRMWRWTAVYVYTNELLSAEIKIQSKVERKSRRTNNQVAFIIHFPQSACRMKTLFSLNNCARHSFAIR